RVSTVPTPTPTVFYTLSLHDALPIYLHSVTNRDALTPGGAADQSDPAPDLQLIPEATLQATTATNTGSITDDRFGLNLSRLAEGDRKSTRLNSSHVSISYAVFCLKKQ